MTIIINHTKGALGVTHMLHTVPLQIGSSLVAACIGCCQFV